LHSQLKETTRQAEAKEETMGIADVHSKIKAAEDEYDKAFQAKFDALDRYGKGHPEVEKAERALERALDRCEKKKTALEQQCKEIFEQCKPSEAQMRTLNSQLAALGDVASMNVILGRPAVDKIEKELFRAIHSHPDMIAVKIAVKTANDQLRDAYKRRESAIRERKDVQLSHSVMDRADASETVKAAARVHLSVNAYDVLSLSRTVKAKDSDSKTGAHSDDFDDLVKRHHAELRNTLQAGAGDRMTAADGQLLHSAILASDAALGKLKTLELRRKYEMERIQGAVGPFAVLGLLRNATPVDVSARRNELQLMLRPDQTKSDELTEAVKRVNDAYEMLSDSEKRAEYEKEHPLQQCDKDAPGGGSDWRLGKAVQKRHEETLQMLLDPLYKLFPPKGVKTTIKTTLTTKVEADPAFTLVCDLDITEAKISFTEQVGLDNSFRAATIQCTAKVGKWNLKVTVPFEVATLHIHAPSLATAVGKWMAKNDVVSMVKEVREQVNAQWEEDRRAEKEKYKAKWPNLTYQHPTTKPPDYLKGFEGWCNSVGGESSKRPLEPENDCPNSPVASPSKQRRLM